MNVQKMFIHNVNVHVVVDVLVKFKSQQFDNKILQFQI